MQPFTLEQKQYLEHEIVNGLIAVVYAVKHGDLEGARKSVERIERSIKDLPVYFCEDQFYAKNIRTMDGEEISGLVCVKKRRLCPYNKETKGLCDKDGLNSSNGLNGSKCEEGACDYGI